MLLERDLEFIEECEKLFTSKNYEKLLKNLNRLYDGNGLNYTDIVNELIFNSNNTRLSNFVENFVYNKEQEFRV